MWEQICRFTVPMVFTVIDAHKLTYHMRVLVWICYCNICQLYVQKLVHWVKSPTNTVNQILKSDTKYQHLYPSYMQIFLFYLQIKNFLITLSKLNLTFKPNIYYCYNTCIYNKADMYWTKYWANINYAKQIDTGKQVDRANAPDTHWWPSKHDVNLIKPRCSETATVWEAVTKSTVIVMFLY